MRSLRLLALSLLVLPLACDDPFSARDELELVVLERPTLCATFGLTTYPCPQVIELPGSEPVPFYGSIEGFNVEPGVRYRILVARYIRKNPPLDGSSYEYRLLRVISRERVFWVLDSRGPDAAPSN